MIITLYALRKRQFNVTQEHLTYYRNYPSSYDKKYKKFVNFEWWKRRLQAFEFLNYVDKKKHQKNKFSFDYIITRLVNSFSFFF